jgi:hypothetical protein
MTRVYVWLQAWAINLRHRLEVWAEMDEDDA